MTEPPAPPPGNDGLAGRTALVTGATSDIGAATALALARRGADVALHGHSNVERLHSLREEVEALGRRATAIQADLSLAEEARRVADEALAFGAIDVLVNNAGHVVKRVPWTDLTPEHLDRVFGLNFRAPLFLCQALVPPMQARGKGVVINVLSTAAWTGGTPTVFAYGAAKAALWSLTHGLAGQVAADGVRVLSVAPGTVDTEFQREPGNRALWETWVDRIPVERIGRPDEIGEVVGFLATDAAGFIVGETIHVNGGSYMS